MAAKQKILSVAKTDFLRRTRRVALRKAGYEVESAADLNDIERLCKSTTFAAAVVGSAFEPEVKRTIADVIRKYCPTLPIVELTLAAPDISGSIPSTPDASDLIAGIQAAVRKPKTRKATNSG
jgi:DNA-binding NtrC family response regulator